MYEKRISRGEKKRQKRNRSKQTNTRFVDIPKTRIPKNLERERDTSRMKAIVEAEQEDKGNKHGKENKAEDTNHESFPSPFRRQNVRSAYPFHLLVPLLLLLFFFPCPPPILR